MLGMYIIIILQLIKYFDKYSIIYIVTFSISNGVSDILKFSLIGQCVVSCGGVHAKIFSRRSMSSLWYGGGGVHTRIFSRRSMCR